MVCGQSKDIYLTAWIIAFSSFDVAGQRKGQDVCLFVFVFVFVFNLLP